MKGLLGKTSLGAGEGIFLTPCTSIHMFFMKFPIDVVFVSSDLEAIALYSKIKPWKISGIHPSAAGAIEAYPGWIEDSGIEVGSALRFQRSIDSEMSLSSRR